MRIIGLIFCLLISAISFSQNNQISIDSDSRVDSLMIKQIEINKQNDGVNHASWGGKLTFDLGLKSSNKKSKQKTNNKKKTDWVNKASRRR